jgi:hypothetical protein
MNKDNETRLQAEFPFMRPREGIAEKDKFPYETNGCECGDGWYDILRNLCLDITAAYNEHGKEIDLIPHRVKEKFGALHFRCELSETDERPLSSDIAGVGNRLVARPYRTAFGGVIVGILDKWEAESEHVCELCGAPGRLRGDLERNKTLCESCYELALHGG